MSSSCFKNPVLRLLLKPDGNSLFNSFGIQLILMIDRRTVFDTEGSDP